MKYIGIIETKNNGVLYSQRDNKKLYAGTATNCGISEQFDFKIDDCFSLDENLQTFIEEMEEY